MTNSKNPSLRQLAALVGVSHSTVSRHLRQNPDAPIQEADKFVEYWLSTHADKADSETCENLPRELLVERIRKTRAEATLAEKKVQVFTGGYVQLSEVSNVVEMLATELNAALQRKFCHELPRACIGRSMQEIKEMNTDALEEIYAAHRQATGKHLQESEATARESVRTDVTKTATAKRKRKASK